MQWLTSNLCSMTPLGRDVVNVVGMFAAAGLLMLAMKWHHSVLIRDANALMADALGTERSHRASVFWMAAVAWMTLGVLVMIGGGVLGVAMLRCAQPFSEMFRGAIPSAFTIFLGAGVVYYAWSARSFR